MKVLLLAVSVVGCGALVACSGSSSSLVDGPAHITPADDDEDAPDDEGSAPPGCASVTGTVQGASALNVREEATADSAVTGTVAEGDALTIFCQAQGDAVKGNAAWDYLGANRGYVADAYVQAEGVPPCTPTLLACGKTTSVSSSSSSGSVGTPGGDTPPSPLGSSPAVDIEGPAVQPQVQAFANDVCAITGACTISTYEGHDPSADLAIDILISDEYGELPKDDNALGEHVAAYALANQVAYQIEYVIFRQRIDLGSGWKDMEDRGSITENHFDHVHVTFEP